MLEKEIERKVCDYAKSKGVITFKFTSPARIAVCDRMFICRGRVWFIEFKRDGQKPTPAQTRHHQELAKQNIAVYVVDNVTIGKEITDYESQQDSERHHWSAIRYVDSTAAIP